MTTHFYSLTLHYTPEISEKWKEFRGAAFRKHIESLTGCTEYFCSEIITDMAQDGGSDSLLLGFDSAEALSDFKETELYLLEEKLQHLFGTNLLLFKTHLNLHFSGKKN